MPLRHTIIKLGPEYSKALANMCMLDAIICNAGNFGVLVDNETNRIIASAPLFDHGNSLFNFAGRDDLESETALEKYADTIYPAAYG